MARRGNKAARSHAFLDRVFERSHRSFQRYLASGFVEVGDGAEQTEYVSNAEIISALASEAIYLSEENGKAFFRSLFEKAITRRNVQGDLALANVIPALAAGLSVMRLPREQLTYLDHLACATERIAGHGARAKTIEKLFEKLSLIDIACRDVAYGDLRDRGFRFVERELKAEMISAAAKQLTALPHDRRDQRRTELVAKLTEIEALDPAAIPEPIPEPEVAPAVARAGLTALAGSFEDPAAGVLFYRQYKQRACQIDSPQARSEMFPSLVQGLRFINSPIERTQEFAFLANDVLATNFFRNANPQFESVARTKAVGELLNALDVVESTTEQAQLLHKFSNHAQSIENNATKVEQIGHVARRLCAPMSDESRVEIVNTLGKALTPIVKYQRFKMEENNALQRGFEGMGAAVKAIQDNSARYEGVRQLTHLELSLKEDYSRSIAARGVRSTISVAVPEERPNLAWRLTKNVRYEVSFAFELGIGNPASMPSRRLAILQTSNVSRPGFIIER
jgi:hypothetical protein